MVESLLQHFLKKISQGGLIDQNDRILVAVSGGIDSMTLLYLMEQLPNEVAVVHINYNLRDKESDLDEELVVSYCEEAGIPLFTKNFNLRQYLNENGGNLQAEARSSRYAYFEEILTEHNYHKVALAHHLSDHVETVIYNIAKGSGIQGAMGISPQRGPYIRPLLTFKKSEIDQLAAELGIKFREDKSNVDDRYFRNAIRHQILPTLESINPQFEKATERFTNILRDHKEIAEYLIEERGLAGRNKLLFSEINSLPGRNTVLYYLLSPFGFNAEQIDNICQRQKHTGAIFRSQSHEILIDRGSLLIRKQENSTHLVYSISINSPVELPGFTMSLERVKRPEKWPMDPSIAFLSIAKTTLPLTIRKWQPGDSFQPLGMQGKTQKVKDFLINNKVDQFKKENTYVGLCDDKIVWLVNHRIDHRFQVGDLDEDCYKLTTKAIDLID